MAIFAQKTAFIAEQADGTVSEGMIPKILTAVQAVENGVGGAAIVDGREDHAVLKELFSAASGT